MMCFRQYVCKSAHKQRRKNRNRNLEGKKRKKNIRTLKFKPEKRREPSKRFYAHVCSYI